jgi:hypothetical protein
VRLLIIEDNRDLSIELTGFFEQQGDNTIDTVADGIADLHLPLLNKELSNETITQKRPVWLV